MDAMEISCTSSSTVSTTMMQPKSNDVKSGETSQTDRLGKRDQQYPHCVHDQLVTWTRLLFFAGVSSCGNEVKATSLHVVDRTAIVASLMPTGDLQRPSDKREDPRHEWSKMKHVCCREVQPRGRSARDGPRSWTSRTLKVVCEMDTSAGHGNSRSEASNLILNWNVSSHADGTEIMGGDCSVSNAAADDCQTSVHHSENSKASSEDETETGLVIVLLAMQSGGTIVCLFK